MHLGEIRTIFTANVPRDTEAFNVSICPKRAATETPYVYTELPAKVRLTPTVQHLSSALVRRPTWEEVGANKKAAWNYVTQHLGRNTRKVWLFRHFA